MLAKIRHSLSRQTLLNVYFALFQSHLTYASQIWGQPSTEVKKKVLTAQNKCLRIINFKGPLESADPLYKTNGILKLTDHIKLQNTLTAFKHHQNQLPSALSEILTPKITSHSHYTRTHNNLYEIPDTKTITFGSFGLRSLVPRNWNDLVTTLKIDPNTMTLKKFKKTVTTHLLQHYKTS